MGLKQKYGSTEKAQSQETANPKENLASSGKNLTGFSQNQAGDYTNDLQRDRYNSNADFQKVQENYYLTPVTGEHANQDAKWNQDTHQWDFTDIDSNPANPYDTGANRYSSQYDTWYNDFGKPWRGAKDFAGYNESGIPLQESDTSPTGYALYKAWVDEQSEGGKYKVDPITGQRTRVYGNGETDENGVIHQSLNGYDIDPEDAESMLFATVFNEMYPQYNGNFDAFLNNANWKEWFDFTNDPRLSKWYSWIDDFEGADRQARFNNMWNYMGYLNPAEYSSWDPQDQLRATGTVAAINQAIVRNLLHEGIDPSNEEVWQNARMIQPALELGSYDQNRFDQLGQDMWNMIDAGDGTYRTWSDISDQLDKYTPEDKKLLAIAYATGPNSRYWETNANTPNDAEVVVDPALLAESGVFDDDALRAVLLNSVISPASAYAGETFSPSELAMLDEMAGNTGTWYTSEMPYDYESLPEGYNPSYIRVDELLDPTLARRRLTTQMHNVRPDLYYTEQRNEEQ
jgi:hypothetical protein